SLADDCGGSLEVTGVRQRVAQERRVADVHRYIVRNLLTDARQAVVEDPNGAVWSAKRRVRLSERRVQVGSEMRWRRAFSGDGGLEPLDGFEVIPPLRRCQPECHTGANRGNRVARGES